MKASRRRFLKTGAVAAGAMAVRPHVWALPSTGFAVEAPLSLFGYAEVQLLDGNLRDGALLVGGPAHQVVIPGSGALCTPWEIQGWASPSPEKKDTKDTRMGLPICSIHPQAFGGQELT